MAGTIVADTIQEGAGNSTSIDNAIYGSAKAWAYFTYISSVLTIGASYNVSSITRSATGQYVVTFTTSMTDTNYAVVTGGGAYSLNTGSCNIHPNYNATNGTFLAPTTSVFNIGIVNEAGTVAVDPYTCAFAVHR